MWYPHVNRNWFGIYVNWQVRAVFRWRVSIQTYVKYLIKKKNPVYGDREIYVIPTYEQKLIFVCKDSCQ